MDNYVDKKCSVKNSGIINKYFLTDFRKNNDLNSIIQGIEKYQNTPLSNIFRSGYNASLGDKV